MLCFISHVHAYRSTPQHYRGCLCGKCLATSIWESRPCRIGQLLVGHGNNWRAKQVSVGGWMEDFILPRYPYVMCMLVYIVCGLSKSPGNSSPSLSSPSLIYCGIYPKRLSQATYSCNKVSQEPGPPEPSLLHSSLKQMLLPSLANKKPLDY